MSDKVIRILSIEDSTADAMLIEEMLSVASSVGWNLPRFELEHVVRLKRGLDCLDSCSPLSEGNGGGPAYDVVLTDLDLPDSRAQETFAAIHAHVPDLPIVVLTGRDDEALARETVRAGAEDYLFKRELSGSLLAHALIYAIERQQAKRALRKAHDQLESRVTARTRELQRANAELRAEVAERQQAEAALAASEARYRLLVDNAPLGVVVVDLEGNIVHTNQTFVDLVGSTSRAFVESVNVLTFPHSIAAGIAEDFQRCVETLGPLVAERRYVASTGKESYLRYHLVPIRDDADQFIEVLCVVEDITAHHQIEMRLRESRERYRALVENAGDVVAVVDAMGTFHYINGVGARLLGGEPEDFIGKTMEQLFPPEIAASQLAMVRRVIETDQGTVLESTTFLQEEHRWYRTNIQPLHNHQGEVTVAILSAHDFTDYKMAQERNRTYARELQRANQALVRSNQELEHVVRAISHDLQEPLRAILGHVTSLQRRYGGQLDHQADRWMAQTVQEAERLRRMLEATLNLSRAEEPDEFP